MKRALMVAFWVLIIAMVVCVAMWFFNDPNQRPVYPVESKANNILVTSNVCCAMVYDFKLTMCDKHNNEEIVICEADEVSEFDVFKYKIPKVNVDDFEIMLSCDVYYGENYLFDKSIVVGSDFDEFKKSGLLIYFQEADGMYVNVITANHHDTYKLMEESEDLWNLRDEPNRVFAEG